MGAAFDRKTDSDRGTPGKETRGDEPDKLSNFFLLLADVRNANAPAVPPPLPCSLILVPGKRRSGAESTLIFHGPRPIFPSARLSPALLFLLHLLFRTIVKKGKRWNWCLLPAIAPKFKHAR